MIHKVGFDEGIMSLFRTKPWIMQSILATSSYLMMEDKILTTSERKRTLPCWRVTSFKILYEENSPTCDHCLRDCSSTLWSKGFDTGFSGQGLQLAKLHLNGPPRVKGKGKGLARLEGRPEWCQRREKDEGEEEKKLDCFGWGCGILFIKLQGPVWARIM